MPEILPEEHGTAPAAIVTAIKESHDNAYLAKVIPNYRAALVVGASYRVISAARWTVPKKIQKPGELAELLAMVVCRTDVPEMPVSFLIDEKEAPTTDFTIDPSGRPKRVRFMYQLDKAEQKKPSP